MSQGIRELRTELHNILKTRGFLVLDAHFTATDIFGSLIWLRLNFPKAKILVPAAGWLFYRFPNNLMLAIVKNIFNIELMPVYRSQELIPEEEQKYTKFYPHKITIEVKKARNKAYLERASIFLNTPNSILAVAPYGDPLKFGQNIKSGVLKLFEQNPKIIITWTKKIGLLRKTYVANFPLIKNADYHKELLLAYENIDSKNTA